MNRKKYILSILKKCLFLKLTKRNKEIIKFFKNIKQGGKKNGKNDFKCQRQTKK